MSDYGVLKARILRELNRSDLVQEASAAVQTAIKFYETTRFWFNEQRATNSTVDGQEFYKLPSDFVSPDKLVIRRSGEEYSLIQIDYDTISDWIEQYPARRGSPKYYALYANQIRCYPVPDATASTLVLSYVRALPALVNDSDSNEWTKSAEGLIRGHAERDIAGNVLHDPALASMYGVFTEGELRRLEKLTGKKVSSGKAARRDFPIER